MRWTGWGPLRGRPWRSRVHRWLVRCCVDGSSGGRHGGSRLHCQRRGRLLHPLLLGSPVVRLQRGGVDPGRPGLVPHGWLLGGCCGRQPALLCVVLRPGLSVLGLLHLLVLASRLSVGHIDWVAWRGGGGQPLMKLRGYTHPLHALTHPPTPRIDPPTHSTH